uniref:Lipocalin/cytosolic fatty-acid binding domain-containing protein n=1 Tax=Leptobrachium leishanense TaxID=445787 RepID=A0A8C5QQP3_9ANUR
MVVIGAILRFSLRSDNCFGDSNFSKIRFIPGCAQFSGQWYLLSIASECNYLKVNNHRVEATVVQASRSTKPKATEDLDGICWEIRHEYPKNKVSGRFTVKGRGSSLMVVGETDYENYAILYYQRQRKITLKLYGRKKTASDDIYRKFDEHVSGQGIDLIYIYPFPSYGE